MSVVPRNSRRSAGHGFLARTDNATVSRGRARRAAVDAVTSCHGDAATWSARSGRATSARNAAGAWLSTSGGGRDRVGRPGLGEADRGGRSVRAGGRVCAGVLNSLELKPEVLVLRGGRRHE